jgi:putative hemolysin
MLSELFITVAVLAVLLWAVHSLASVTVQVLRLSDEIEDEHHGFSPRRRHLLHRLVQNPRDLKLTAELSTSLIYLIMVVMAGWMVNRWTADLGWLRVPVVAVSLILVWMLNTLVRGVLPKVISPEASAHVSWAGLAGIALVWRLSRPFRLILGRVTGRRDRSKPTAEEREEIVERAIETLAHSTGLDEPLIEDDEREMIRGVIGLDATEVREVMVPRVHIVALEADASLEDVRKVTAEYGYSRFPIYEEDLDSIIGILYVKDLFTGLPTDDELDLASIARDAFVVPETKKVDSLLEEFKRRKTHIAIVADEFGGTAGLVTLEDILEEIVGEIQDEHDPRGEPVELTPDGSILAEGVVPLIEIADKLGVSLPDEKFETVGGLVYDRVGGIPEIGRIIEEHGLIIRIEAMDGQRISRVRVTRTPPPATA